MMSHITIKREPKWASTTTTQKNITSHLTTHLTVKYHRVNISIKGVSIFIAVILGQVQEQKRDIIYSIKDIKILY